MTVNPNALRPCEPGPRRERFSSDLFFGEAKENVARAQTARFSSSHFSHAKEIITQLLASIHVPPTQHRHIDHALRAEVRPPTRRACLEICL